MADKKKQKTGPMRLDKFLGEMGYGTRTQIKEMVRKGRVQVNGQVIKAPESKLAPETDQVMVDRTRLYPAVRPVFEELRRQGCRIGIVTTKYHYRIDQILDKFQIAGLVDVIVGAEDVKAEKPSPEGLLYAMEQLGADRSEVLYTGDSVVDAKTAAAAAVDFAGVLTGTTSSREFELFDHICIVRDLAELMNALTQDK